MFIAGAFTVCGLQKFLYMILYFNVELWGSYVKQMLADTLNFFLIFTQN